MSKKTPDNTISQSEISDNNNIKFEPPMIGCLDLSKKEPSENDDIREKNTHIRKSSIIKLQGQSRPVANYYAEIIWNDGFQNWPIVRFSTPMDGNCLFHAISNSFFTPYHDEILNGNHITRGKMISLLRKQLAEKLAEPISNIPDSPRYYDTLNGGNTSAFSQAVPEFELKYMQSQLDSNTPIGYGYMEFIGNSLNKDIYILEALRRDIYITDELPLTITGDRKSIVLYYLNGHYELVGIRNTDGTFTTHFSSEHSFIRFLYNRVKQIIQQII
jgi:hypothetical protein